MGVDNETLAASDIALPLNDCIVADLRNLAKNATSENDVSVVLNCLNELLKRIKEFETEPGISASRLSLNGIRAALPRGVCDRGTLEILKQDDRNMRESERCENSALLRKLLEEGGEIRRPCRKTRIPSRYLE